MALTRRKTVTPAFTVKLVARPSDQTTSQPKKEPCVGAATTVTQEATRKLNVVTATSAPTTLLQRKLAHAGQDIIVLATPQALIRTSVPLEVTAQALASPNNARLVPTACHQVLQAALTAIPAPPVLSVLRLV